MSSLTKNGRAQLLSPLALLLLLTSESFCHNIQKKARKPQSYANLQLCTATNVGPVANLKTTPAFFPHTKLSNSIKADDNRQVTFNNNNHPINQSTKPARQIITTKIEIKQRSYSKSLFLLNNMCICAYMWIWNPLMACTECDWVYPHFGEKWSFQCTFRGWNIVMRYSATFSISKHSLSWFITMKSVNFLKPNMNTPV